MPAIAHCIVVYINMYCLFPCDSHAVRVFSKISHVQTLGQLASVVIKLLLHHSICNDLQINKCEIMNKHRPKSLPITVPSRKL